MRKYPVISTNNNVYEAEVFFGDSIALAGLNVILRKVSRKRGRRAKMVNVFEHTELISPEETYDIYGDFSDVVSYFVSEHEGNLSKKKKVEKSAEDFEEWDGVIRQKEE